MSVRPSGRSSWQRTHRLEGGGTFSLLNELLLFEGTTQLSTGGTLTNPGDALTAARWSANPAVDALAWGPGAAAVPFAATHVLDADAGDLIIRPTVSNLVLMDQPLIGTADSLGRFTSGALHYATNPGFSNLNVAALVPEPGTWAVALAGLAVVLTRGRGRVRRVV